MNWCGGWEAGDWGKDTYYPCTHKQPSGFGPDTHRCECVRWNSQRANLKKWLRDDNGLWGWQIYIKKVREYIMYTKIVIHETPWKCIRSASDRIHTATPQQPAVSTMVMKKETFSFYCRVMGVWVGSWMVIEIEEIIKYNWISIYWFSFFAWNIFILYSVRMFVLRETVVWKERRFYIWNRFHIRRMTRRYVEP